MSQTINSNAESLIEDVVRMMPPKAMDRARQLFRDVFLRNLVALSPGGNLIQPGGPQANASKPPVGVTHTVSGANGVLTVSIANPQSPQGTPIYHEFSYSPNISFVGRNITTLPPTTNTSITIPAVGGNFYGRLRSSYDLKTWTNYTLSSRSPIEAGYVESSAISSGATFNQTNLAVVSSESSSDAATIAISGPSGAFTPYIAIKGAVQSRRPSATIVGLQFGPSQFVGWDGSQFQVKNTLAAVLADNLEPVGGVMIGNSQTGGGGTAGGNGGRLTQDLNTMMGQ